MKTCLVVDDSSVIRKVARRILEQFDFQIVEAEDGQQALDACQKLLPDAILLDWNMPKMDGYDFLKALRRLPGGDRPKVVFCTTENDVAHIARALHAGGAHDWAHHHWHNALAIYVELGAPGAEEVRAALAELDRDTAKTPKR